MLHLGIDGHDRGNIAAAAFYGLARPLCLRLRGRRRARPLNHRAKNRRKAATEREGISGLQRFASRRPALAVALRWHIFVSPFQPRAVSPGPAAQSDGGGGHLGQLSDLVRCKEAGY
jgi:hypothetical protein